MRKKMLPIIMMLLTISTTAQMNGDSSSIKIDEVIIQANRLQLPVSENSNTVNIITRQQLENNPVHSVAEALQNVAGLDIRQRGVHGIQADVSLRGGTFDQVLILINGVKMADPQTGHHALNIPLNMDNIERIEILKGPAARIYGANAFAGAINIVTRTPDKAFVNINLEGGQNSLGAISISAALPKGDFNQYFSVGRQFSDGYRFNSDYDISNYLYQAEYKIDATQKLDVMGTFTDREFGANRFYGGTSEFWKNQYEEIQTSLFNIGHQKVTDKFAIKTRFNWRRNQDEYLLIRDEPNFYRNLHISNVLTLESHANFHSELGTTGVGVELSSVYLRSNNLGKRDHQIATLFLEHRASFLNNKIDLTPGIAISQYSDFGARLFQGIDLGYKISKGVKLFGNMGYTWRIPTFTDLFYEDAGNMGNDKLEPESALSYEFGVKYDANGVRANLSWFLRDGTDLIDWTKAADTLKWQPNNISNLAMMGIDASIDFNPTARFGKDFFLKNIRLGYTFIDAEVPQNIVGISRYVLENLNHQFTARIDYRIGGKLFHNISYKYIDRETMDDYSLIDTKFYWKADNYSIYLAANNLLDVEYFETNLVQMPGTWIYGGVKIRLDYSK
ncbi:MAG: TonB-dependent receptor [Saprospiraceae bacterium]|nr:TonB-dependent receptor [Saprospiraceae bacterium]MDG2417621.1 TonB-dependent receptor [Saprospiraceae bacterium]